MLPFEVIGRDFERSKVISWLRAYVFNPEFQSWVSEINSRGIRQSLRSYEGVLPGFEPVCDLIRQIFEMHGHKSEVLFPQITDHGYELTTVSA